jgi:hypothetical protein
MMFYFSKIPSFLYVLSMVRHGFHQYGVADNVNKKKAEGAFFFTGSETPKLCGTEEAIK